MQKYLLWVTIVGVGLITAGAYMLSAKPVAAQTKQSSTNQSSVAFNADCSSASLTPKFSAGGSL